MNGETMCEICGERNATDECVGCHKKVCSDCSIPQMGVCIQCSKPQEKGLITLLIGCGAVQYGSFTLASGRQSSYYVDIKKAITDMPTLKKIADMMAPYVTDVGKIGCVELGGVPIAVAVALQVDRPYIIVRKKKKEHGMEGAFEGELADGETVVFVEDVTTTAGSLVTAIDLIRQNGGVVEKALVVVDREEGAAENLGNVGVELIPLVRARDIIR